MAKWVMDLMFGAGYFGIVFLMTLENVFPPIPSEVIMPLAGYMATQGKFSLLGIILAGTAGSVLGALPLYYFGRKLGEERVKDFADRHGRWLTVCSDDIERAGRWFDRHNASAVFLCRLVPGLRSLISIPAGIKRMHLAAFLAYTTAGAALWTTLLAWLGFFLGRNFRKVEAYLDPLSWIVLAIVLGLYIVRVVRHKGSNRAHSTA